MCGFPPHNKILKVITVGFLSIVASVHFRILSIVVSINGLSINTREFISIDYSMYPADVVNFTFLSQLHAANVIYVWVYL